MSFRRGIRAAGLRAGLQSASIQSLRRGDAPRRPAIRSSTCRRGRGSASPYEERNKERSLYRGGFETRRPFGAGMQRVAPPAPRRHMGGVTPQLPRHCGGKEIRHVHSTGQTHRSIHARDRGRRGEAAPRLRLRRHRRVRSLPAARRFPQRPPRGLPRRFPLASPSRHRDHHLCAGGHGGSRRQPGQSRQARRRRRPVDDRRQRHPPPGNAARRHAGAACTASSCGRTCRPRSK